jgi:Domain of unknown function (DUF4878)
MKKMKKLLLLMMVVGLTFGVLAGCSSTEPKDTVQEFLTAIQKGDIEKAHTYVDSADKGYDFSKMMETKDGISGKEVLDAITKNYKFEAPVEVSKKDDTAEVKVKITSVDMSVAITKTLGEVMPMAFASAFSEDKEQAEQTMEKLATTTMIKHLSAEDATMATREVTLNLKKDTEGNYKIVSDENLQEALLANSKEMDKMFEKK